MDDKLRRYLEWRYKMNNHNKYQKYRDEWINNLLEKDLWYFKIEMEHLIKSSIYKI